ncbi:hypothetical protein [Caballeronia sp. GACF4]|uniref:hypothetical protein n=1 Tax=Caballeronia sp. GACF4 TaxID=2921763 RepID=UPI002027E026|nr:hypothetical protein [Caballeronia sp. GACF4]
MTSKSPRDSRADVIDALQALEDLVITVDFDRDDPSSIEAAVRSVNAAIDTSVAAYRGHPMVESAIAELKAECQAGLYEQAERADAYTPGISDFKKPTLH